MLLRGAAALALGLLLALVLLTGSDPKASQSAAATDGMGASRDSFAARIGSAPPASQAPAPLAVQPASGEPGSAERRAAAAVWSVPAEFAPPERY